jgi:hypothetical protein
MHNPFSTPNDLVFNIIEEEQEKALIQSYRLNPLLLQTFQHLQELQSFLPPSVSVPK